MRRIRIPIATLLVFTLLFAAPVPAYAAGGPLGFIKNVIDRVANAVDEITAPPRKIVTAATRWMGPVLGPLAADLVMQRVISSNSSVREVFRRLSQARDVSQNIEDVERQAERLRNAYRDDARAHTSAVEQLEWQAQAIKDDPLAGDIKQLIRIRSLQDGHERMAERLTEQANSVSVEDLLALAGQRIVRNTVNSARNIVVQESRAEIERLLGIEVIEDFSAGGMSPEQVISVVVNGDVDMALIRSGFDPAEVGEARDRIASQLRTELENRRSNLRETWPATVRQIVSQNVRDVREGSTATPKSGFTISAPYGITITVRYDGTVIGEVNDSETAGEVTVTMKATFNGTMNEDGDIVATGTYTSSIITPDEAVNEAGTVSVRARKLSETTYEVMVTPSGGSAQPRGGAGTVKR
jgi:hypothetical protein